ncbi:MAG: hypothetical protein GX971_11735 [Firmicutes bacterium]|nr:hypothetical protein [Bacillota bacterium]
MTDQMREESANVLESLLQIVGLLFTNYPVVSPLLEDLRENLRQSLVEATHVLPKITQVLNEIEIDNAVREKFASQLFEAVPELRKFLQRTER